MPNQYLILYLSNVIRLSLCPSQIKESAFHLQTDIVLFSTRSQILVMHILF